MLIIIPVYRIVGPLGKTVMLVVQLFFNWWQTCIPVGLFYVIGIFILISLRREKTFERINDDFNGNRAQK